MESLIVPPAFSWFYISPLEIKKIKTERLNVPIPLFLTDSVFLSLVQYHRR